MSEQIYELMQEQHYQAESHPSGIMEIAQNERQDQSQHKELKLLRFYHAVKIPLIEIRFCLFAREHCLLYLISPNAVGQMTFPQAKSN